MKITKNTIQVKATESGWLRRVKFNEAVKVVAVTKLARRKTSRDTRVTHFWYCPDRNTFEALGEALGEAIEAGTSMGAAFNKVLQPVQRALEAEKAIETAKGLA